MSIILSLAGVAHLISNVFLGTPRTIITLAIAIVLAVVFTLCC